MSKYQDIAKEIRNDSSVHYNCAQAILLTFSDILKEDRETLLGIGANLGGGMKVGSICGAITGGIILLGLLGKNSEKDSRDLYNAIRTNHNNLVDCKELLAVNAKNGGNRKEHCDNMVYEVVKYIEEII